MRRRVKATIALCIFLGLAGGCARQPHPDLFAQAETLVLDAHYDEAISLLKQRLLQRPDDAGAHYYLARCYLFGQKPWYALAQGELETALTYFERHGKALPIPRFNEPYYFEMICYVDMGKLRLREIMSLLENGATRDVLVPFQQHLRDALQKARGIAKDAPEVKELAEHADALDKLIDALPERLAPTPRPQAPSRRNAPANALTET